MLFSSIAYCLSLLYAIFMIAEGGSLKLHRFKRKKGIINSLIRSLSIDKQKNSLKEKEL